jgi:hypothetical protein
MRQIEFVDLDTVCISGIDNEWLSLQVPVIRQSLTELRFLLDGTRPFLDS